MNDKEQFYNEFYSALGKAMEPDGGKLYEMDIQKNNGMVKGVTIKLDHIPMAPTVYPDSYFDGWQAGQTMSDIASGIRDEIVRSAPSIAEFDVSNINKNAAADHLCAAVVSYDSNKDWLCGIPHERMADLAVFAKWKVGKSDSDAVMSTKVTDQLLAHLQLTKEEMLKIAKANTAKGYKFESMEQVMLGIMQENGMDDGLIADLQSDAVHPLYVLTNENGLDGAALIANPSVLREVREQLDEDFYILPSSIHEVLIVQKSDSLPVDELKEMVQGINEMEVPVEDQLSDNVYEFDGHSIKIAGTELTQEHDISESITHHRGR